MIAGIGVDIAEIARFERLLDRYGNRFAHRILTAGEMQVFEQRGGSFAFLASRFAAKEAASKALGTGIAQGVGFHMIEISNSEHGKPQLLLHDAAAKQAQSLAVTSSHLSLSDEKHYCVAMVILER